MSVLQHFRNLVLRALGAPVIDLTGPLSADPKWHQGLIIHLAAILKPKIYVELGIFKCGLFNQMIPYAGQLHGVDANPEAGRYMVKSEKTKFIAATTQQYIDNLKKDPIHIDMAFIDADHSREAVHHDFTGILPFVRPHGLVLLHDTHPLDKAATHPDRCGDGYRAIEQFSRTAEEYEMVTIPVHPGLTICRKRSDQLGWQEAVRSAGSKA